ncbi:TIGR04222 domain-containing membrane protein [Amycolatopsis mongoliensis]|uniref:TIGR04222 domain-containing membrane protein n=1 Tax=Amycolatopsis mongoliensis TaxID=715475 RepID=A0A9Y2JI64_9PSEU|nr:TIGR04222 domain-containing membrane protein [Amycolatopsis sp. 4-36]WIX97746.1 TIGR04222 domain-containing membrane protein [Amycolatopsis sp. 4-36]
MTDTWGIPGPLFTGLYLGLLLLPAAYAAVRTRQLLRGRAAGVPEKGEELALLTGGRTRAGEFVVARLLERQTIRMDGTGRVHRVRGSAPDDLGRAALARIGKTGTAVDSVRREVRQHPALVDLEHGLIARGLLVDVRKVRLTWVSTAVAYWAVVVLGVVRLIAGSSTGHPVGFLLGLLVLGTVAAVFVTTRAANTPEVKATAAGRAAAREAERAGSLTSGPAGAVAAGGFGSHPDKDVRLAISRSTVVADTRASIRRSRWAGAGGAAAVGYYGGSSCGGGGGSSCGGGGGGCGGGGGGCGG